MEMARHLRAVEMLQPCDGRIALGFGLAGEQPALTTPRDVLTHKREPSRAPDHLPARHDDGAATAELHEVDLLIGGTEQHKVGNPEVEYQRPLHAFLRREDPDGQRYSTVPFTSSVCFWSRSIAEKGWLPCGSSGIRHDARLFPLAHHME